MTTTRTRLALDHAHQAHLYAGQLAWLIRQLDVQGHLILPANELDAFTQVVDAAQRHLMRAAVILVDLRHAAVTIRIHRRNLPCACGRAAEWDKAIRINLSQRQDWLPLCSQCLAESSEESEA